jgi:hypothetical protein
MPKPVGIGGAGSLWSLRLSRGGDDGCLKTRSGADTIIVQVADGSPADTATVKFKRAALAPAGRFFTRLKVVVAIP